MTVCAVAFAAIAAEADAETLRIKRTTRARRSPSLSSRVVFRVKKGARVQLIRQKEDWLKIRFAHRRGWIPRRHASLPDHLAQYAPGSQVVAVRSLKVRHDPDSRAEILFETRRGEHFTTVSTHGDWIEIVDQAKVGRGWVTRDSVRPATGPEPRTVVARRAPPPRSRATHQRPQRIESSHENGTHASISRSHDSHEVARHHEPERNYYRHHFSLFTGMTGFQSDEHGGAPGRFATIGLEYEYRSHKWLGFGPLVEVVDEAARPVIGAFAAYLHLGRVKAFGALGYEGADPVEAGVPILPFARIGIGYDLHLGVVVSHGSSPSWISLAPLAAIDFLPTHVLWVAGMAVGTGF